MAKNWQYYLDDHEALQDLVAENAMLREAIEHSPVQYCVFDEDDYIVAWNPSYESLYTDAFNNFRTIGEGRLSYSDLVAWQMKDRSADPDFANIVEKRVRDQREADGTPVERFYSDEIGWLRVIKYQLPSGGVAGMAVNITDLKSREAALEEATEKALDAERAKSSFLANMSHEIRTPMNGVMGMAELLATTELDAKQSMFADVIIKSGSALLTIINDILDFSKIEAGKMVLSAAPFALTEAIEDVATLVSSKVAEKDIELITRISPDLPQWLLGDVGRIRQIVTNLMGNAVKFTESGQVFVEVTGMPSESDADNWDLHFRVQDTGIGIPSDKCAQVFEKFSQVDESATRKQEGTGLGLSISQSLVELMGGDIGVESELGEGASFFFNIALPNVEGQTEDAVSIAADIDGASVLIVDDNETNRKILTEQLETWGANSAACASGDIGLQILKAAQQSDMRVDCVVLDYQMPEMTGADVLREIRNDGLLSATKVVVLSSVDSGEVSSLMRDLNADAHLTKPTRSALLKRTIADVINGKPMSGSDQAA